MARNKKPTILKLIERTLWVATTIIVAVIVFEQILKK